MRASPNRPTETKTQLIGTVDKVDYSPEDIAAGDGEVVRDATRAPRPDDKQLHWYRVKHGGIVDSGGRPHGGFIGQEGGGRARLPVGKELHDGAYNIDQLRKQGILLEDLGEGPATGPLQAAG